jgi:hypothetical protein
MDGLLEAVAKAAADRIRKVTEQRDHAIVWINNLEDEQAADREQLATARKGQIALHPATTRLMDALRREGMTPRTLCEVANVVDERWRHALESLLTRDREAVIVDPEHAYRATEILRHGRDAYPGCRVANTRKLQSRSSAPQAGTLASMIQSEDQLAMAFVVFRIGNVSLAEDQEELLSGGRAVMADGAYYDGLITEMRRPDGLKIGRAAAPLMEATLSERIARRVEDLKAHGERRAFFDDVLRRLEDCSRPVGDAEKLDALALSLGDLADRRADARRRLARISAQVDPELLDREKRSQALLASLAVDRDELIDRRGSLRSKIAEIGDRLRAGEQSVGSYHCVAVRRRQFRNAVSSTAHLRSLRALYAEHAARPPAKIAAEMSKAALEAMEGHRALNHEIRSALGRYAIDFGDRSMVMGRRRSSPRSSPGSPTGSRPSRAMNSSATKIMRTRPPAAFPGCSRPPSFTNSTAALAGSTPIWKNCPQRSEQGRFMARPTGWSSWSNQHSTISTIWQRPVKPMKRCWTPSSGGPNHETNAMAAPFARSSNCCPTRISTSRFSRITAIISPTICV